MCPIARTCLRSAVSGDENLSIMVVLSIALVWMVLATLVVGLVSRASRMHQAEVDPDPGWFAALLHEDANTPTADARDRRLTAA